ncbi:tRNA pseudouridine(38-40) synthase TruA [Faecalicatena acetigenes]|uniref:tRNA pseudouridine synthase A n=1 Tax=Faecalicatena acetigenes TaxID=2981790 RepID=A0ABT2TDT4_9FIRM|nr:MULTISPECIES: tRNA pseudouridine(38-40) synthase TruA [Lachnospiraceae]MCU6747972.1 tRNA pseudouridine(38-40) synthase TruA [Faecalicatena acetigenes]SCI19073.1 tRNA pseudouridine synthase A [uncultured Clostridium sp.]
MRTYKLTVSYDGTRYQGWQKQKNTDKTIQAIVENALGKTAGYPVEIYGSGRTDAGVHAKGQTLSCSLRGKIREETFQEVINSLLPEDIRVIRTELVKNGFHARYSASGKCYEYHIDTRQKQDVFERRYSYHFPYKVDKKKMEEAARILIGTHDFAAFTDKKEEKSTIRSIYDIMIAGQDGKIQITYRGNGFLYHMVRILTGTLLEVGMGKLTTEEIAGALVTGERKKAGFMAPAKGLFLKEVYY